MVDCFNFDKIKHFLYRKESMSGGGTFVYLNNLITGDILQLSESYFYKTIKNIKIFEQF